MCQCHQQCPAVQAHAGAGAGAHARARSPLGQLHSPVVAPRHLAQQQQQQPRYLLVSFPGCSHGTWGRSADSASNPANSGCGKSGRRAASCRLHSVALAYLRGTPHRCCQPLRAPLALQSAGCGIWTTTPHRKVYHLTIRPFVLHQARWAYTLIHSKMRTGSWVGSWAVWVLGSSAPFEFGHCPSRLDQVVHSFHK